MAGHRERVRRDIIAYTDDHPGCTFQQMVDDWIKDGKNLYPSILWEFVVHCGLSGRFKKG